VNPERRAQVVGAAAAAGLVLLGAGIGIGWAAAPSGHHHPRDVRIELIPGGRLRPGFPHHFPHAVFPPPGRSVPTPLPSGTAT
jgi:hypothetical protein